MAHREQLDFVAAARRLFPAHFRGMDVLEIGSLDINGTIRSFFEGCRYVGIDVAPGPGVDVACQGQDYDAPAQSFDVVISCEVMEHNPYWRETFANMARLVRPDGLVLMTCAAPGRPEHGTARTNPGDSPLTVADGWDYYRNLRPADFRAAGALAPFADHAFFVDWRACDLYFLGSKRPFDPAVRAGLAALRRHYLRRNLASRALVNRLRGEMLRRG